MTKRRRTKKLHLGILEVTDQANRRLKCEDIFEALDAHARAPGGNYPRKQWSQVEIALARRYTLFSVCCDFRDQRFWIITQSDCRSTRVLLPQDYRSQTSG